MELSKKKEKRLWLTKSVTNVSLAAVVKAFALAKLSAKATANLKSTRTFA